MFDVGLVLVKSRYGDDLACPCSFLAYVEIQRCHLAYRKEQELVEEVSEMIAELCVRLARRRLK